MFLKNGVLWCQGNGYFWGITKKYPFPRHQRTPFFKNMNWTVIYNPNGIQNHAKRKKCVWVPSPNTSGLLTGLRIHRVHRIHQIHRSHQSRYKDLSDYSLSKQSWCQSYLFLFTINCGYKSTKSRQFFKILPILLVVGCMKEKNRI